MKKAISFTLLLSLLLSVLLSGCSGPEERAWQKGQKALAEENFGEATAAFAQAGSWQDAEQLLAYAEAAQNLENGNYSEAETAFLALGDFKDCVLMSSYCKAREREETGFSSADADAAVTACAEAYRLYTDLSLFRDCDDRAANCRELLYSKASEWMSLGRYEDAASFPLSAAGRTVRGWKPTAGLQRLKTADPMRLRQNCSRRSREFSTQTRGRLPHTGRLISMPLPCANREIMKRP